ncbi:unnamed protein product [Rotaria sp. Silwood1]|nr:unnamed protein product [Rotaria sp. Silwood1]CAF1665227.1 unnamed protein product [Rotaria sp. Silwood1]CAF5015654.1 unnamed protein product [Rotaria sp. Silwood1]
MFKFDKSELQLWPRWVAVSWTSCSKLFNHCYFIPLPYKDHIQAQEQADTVASIRKTIHEQNLIIRLTDKDNNFYIGLTKELEEKIQKYFTDTNAFIELSENPFNQILDKVCQLLNNFASKTLTKQWQCKEMMTDVKKAELSHLYFNPKTHRDDIPVRPIGNTIHAVTKNISDYLDQTIRPIFYDKCGTTIIIDGAHLIQGVKTYNNKELF